MWKNVGYYRIGNLGFGGFPPTDLAILHCLNGSNVRILNKKNVKLYVFMKLIVHARGKIICSLPLKSISMC
jgi:hypothetical protein